MKFGGHEVKNLVFSVDNEPKVPDEFMTLARSLVENWSLEEGADNTSHLDRTLTLLSSGWNSRDAEGRRAWFRTAIAHLQAELLQEITEFYCTRIDESKWNAAKDAFRKTVQILQALTAAENAQGDVTPIHSQLGKPIQTFSDQGEEAMNFIDGQELDVGQGVGGGFNIPPYKIR